MTTAYRRTLVRGSLYISMIAGMFCLSPMAGCSPDDVAPPVMEVTAGIAGRLHMEAAAQASRFLDRIPIGMESHYGFDSREQFARAVPGRAWQEWTIAADPGSAGRDGAPRITALDRYRVMLTVDGRPRALLTMTMVDGRLVATDLGAAVLARELGETSSRLGAAYRSAPIGRMLRLYDIKGDFLLPDSDAPDRDIRVAPLESARIGLGLESPAPVETTLTTLAPAIRQAAWKGAPR